MDALSLSLFCRYTPCFTSTFFPVSNCIYKLKIMITYTISVIGPLERCLLLFRIYSSRAFTWTLYGGLLLSRHIVATSNQFRLVVGVVSSSWWVLLPWARSLPDICFIWRWHWRSLLSLAGTHTRISVQFGRGGRLTDPSRRNISFSTSSWIKGWPWNRGRVSVTSRALA